MRYNRRMKDTEIRIIVKEPGCAPVERYIDISDGDGVAVITSIVGVYFEMHCIFEEDPTLAMFVNEDGRRLGLAPNFNSPVGVIVGTALFFRRDDPDMAGITAGQMVTLTRHFELNAR